MCSTLIATTLALGTACSISIGSSAAIANAAETAASPRLGGSMYFYGYGPTPTAATVAAEDQAYNRGCRIIYIGRPFHTASPLGPWEDTVVGSCPAAAQSAAVPDYTGGAQFFTGYGQTAAIAKFNAEDQAWADNCKVIGIFPAVQTTDPRGPWKDTVEGACN